MIVNTAFWPCVAGAVLLVVGATAVRRAFAAAQGADKLIVLAPALVAIALAAFGAEHLVLNKAMAPMVPHWIPAHLFWIYFVGLALLATALSFALRRHMEWSALLLAALMLIFVLTMDLPAVIAGSHNRISWVLMLRELAFSGGAMVLSGVEWRRRSARGWSGVPVSVGRTFVAVALIFYGVEYFLHPFIVPGVPLEKLMPAWVPSPSLWNYATGVILLVAGAAMLFGRWCRRAAVSVGVLMLVATVAVYLPVLIMEAWTPQMLEGLNYVGDTMMFGGTVLLVAMAPPRVAIARQLSPAADS